MVKYNFINNNLELSYENSKRIHGIKALVSPSNKSHKNKENLDNNFENKSELKSELNNSEEISVCSICLDQIDLTNSKENNFNMTITGSINVLCGHVFHIECSLKLDDDKCPLCRYNLSPANISSCSLCSCEDDLWMCLICGSINCGAEGISNNHRKEHYINSGHIYARGLGESHHVTFDFSKMCPIHIWLQSMITNSNVSTENEFFKDPKQKVEYLMSEYNSIISSQLENQRLYYINLVKKIEESHYEEEYKLDREIEEMKIEIEKLDLEKDLIIADKNNIFEIVKSNELTVKSLEKELYESEVFYNNLIKEKQKIEFMKENENQNILVEIDNEIEDLQNQIKDLKIHFKNLNNKDIIGASIDLVIDSSYKKRKNKK